MCFNPDPLHLIASNRRSHFVIVVQLYFDLQRLKLTVSKKKYGMDEKNSPVICAIYNVLAIDSNGYKGLLGMYISKSEGANFWLSILTDLQIRGVQDILIACTDNLTGFSDAISIKQWYRVVLFTKFATPSSMCQVKFIKDLKLVYQAINKKTAEDELDNLELKWVGCAKPLIFFCDTLLP